MASSGKEIRVSTKTTTQPCPPVADLIDFALGRTSAAIGSLVQDHLQIDNCNWCQSWVEQAVQQHSGPNIDSRQIEIGPVRHFTTSSPSPDPTPVPENAKWQRQAFRDLETRLRALE
jgi:hypothetical protein